MAMTKHFKVTFDVTAVIDSESEKNLNELLVDLAKKAGSGEKLNPFKQELLIQGLTHGPEGAAAFCIKQGLREFIRDGHSELSSTEQKLMKFSPATVREVFK
ncbi:phage T7 gene 5.5 family protein [Staphylococcus epidermidis]|uniref:HNS binding protein n=1 Tax=Klebsiella phage Patroon TaxID=2562180 RepID=A0A482MG90_9CAUD|nr:DUF2675 domain-containing protein [Staphylococcus epidermidis]MCC3724474.1 DUF2675 domain-containing protein [Staphylococcus epidermidis]QBQ72891.1 HNS binding protein [Klebsiella phage Patroon]